MLRRSPSNSGRTVISRLDVTEACSAMPAERKSLSGDGIFKGLIMKYHEDKRVLSKIEHAKTGLVFKRRSSNRTRPLILNKKILHGGYWKHCTLYWMPKNKVWDIQVPKTYGFCVIMTTLIRVKRLDEVWRIIINMGYEK